MNEELSKLIELSIIDGQITDAKKQLLYKKAQDSGLEQTEMDIYIDAALNKKRTLVSSLNDIKIPDSITNLIHSESQSVRTSTSEKKLKKIQLLFGVIALISTFFPWLSYSYSASFMGTETGSAITLSAWHSGLGVYYIFMD
jgi:zona occludens toxin (predicted ATPase)